ncbi:response regulator [Aerolutibacter daejeonensis]|nr:response regulator [Lysobacter daejeonensis]
MAASLTPTSAMGTDAPQAPVKILLVDDQPGRLLTYRTILEPLNETLVSVNSGMEALKRLMADDFAVILLDVNMPEMDGFETASLIHQHPRFEKTPIIFVTAVNVTDMDRLRGYKLGAVDYVMVPVIPEILRSKVEVLAELHRKRRELQALNESLAADNQALQREKAAQLETLNQSLREANEALALRNAELQVEVAERQRMEQQLRDADQRKDEFLATLAHELRNPLAPLQNALSIRRIGLDGHADPLQDTMERQMYHLVRLIDDLLDVARVTRGKLVLRLRDTTLADVLATAIEIATPAIQTGRHRFTSILPTDALPLHADPERLAQVFANVLNNAAKYSDPGGQIQLEAHREDDTAVVRISDQGIGLSADQLDTVFELFRQVDTGVERTRGGLGIGLTLVRQLTEMHGGKVSVTSPGPGKGTTFEVLLPLCNSTKPTDAPVPPSPAKLPRHRILVVDDNRDSADTLAMMLRVLGQDAIALYDPLAVETAVDNYAPTLAFLDIGMPGRSGYEVARALRDRHGDTLRLVAITGWGQPEDRARTREAGFEAHVVKPPDVDAIRRILAGHPLPE